MPFGKLARYHVPGAVSQVTSNTKYAFKGYRRYRNRIIIAYYLSDNRKVVSFTLYIDSFEL
jgi:hypothetical protein